MTPPMKFYYVAHITLSMWPCEQSLATSIFMRDVIITLIVKGFDQKNHFLEGQSWLKFNNLGLAQLYNITHFGYPATLDYYCEEAG